MTDPVSDKTGEEGALLQICRFYQPDKIYIYMSKEIIENHEKDNRYILCLEHLYKYLKKDFDYEIIERRELEDVHIFDFFYKEYREILYQIHLENPKSEIILNTSSGTPAMKAALFVLCALFNFQMTPVQVATPIKKSNSKAGKIKLETPADYLEIMDLILSDTKIYGDRTEIATKENLSFELRKDIIKNHINKYNYAAALEVAQMIRETLNKRAYFLIEAAFYRNKLDRKNMDRSLNEIGEKFDFYDNSRLRLTEYLLYLSTNIKRDMLLEFIRGISPALDDLFKIAFEKETNIKLGKYLKNIDGKEVWVKKILNSDTNGQKILKVLDRCYNIYDFRNSASSDNFLKLMQSEEFGISQNKITKMAERLRDIESKGRNKAAHQIISIDDEFLKKTIGCTSKNIFQKIKNFATEINLGVKNEHWDSYEYMNEKIIKALNE